MTNDTLTTGLIGGVIGGVLGLLGGVVLAIEQRLRWRRENTAAARLLYYEVINNRIWLNNVVEASAAPLIVMCSQSVWEAEQVRVASLLRGNDLNRIALAYLGLNSILGTRPLVGDEPWIKHLTGDGSEQVADTLASLDASEMILKEAMDKQPWWGQAKLPPAGAWLGVSGGGLMRL